MAQITNIASYKFVQIDDLPAAREQLRSLCRSLGLKGTILLAHEGINLFVAGQDGNVETFMEEIRRDQRFSDLEFKQSPSDHQPFQRMLVRLKREIIAFGVDGIAPQEQTSPKLSPRELKKWLDEGRPFALLDVRNEYEVELGTFKNAVPIGVENFRDFPKAVEELPAPMKEQPVVIFCTGGIRCEKAGPFLEREGFQQILQLDGGILKYFEECGGDHYSGECFVFDRRVAVDASLSETETTQCFACLAPLTAEQQQSPLYVFGEHCPQCFTQPADALSELLSERQSKLLQLTTPLPGSEPYLNHRPVNVPQRCDGFTVLDVLDHLLPHKGRDFWQQVCQEGRMHYDHAPIAAEETVRAGQRLEHLLPGTVEPDVNAGIHFLYEDSAIIVIDKPAPLPMHPCGRFNRNTVSYLLGQVYHPIKPRVAHRLDANTSGIVILTKTRAIAPLVQSQFERGEVEKTYLARVHGHPEQDEFICNASIANQPSQAGGREIDPTGLSARTSFEVVARLDDETAIVRVRPLTGRTNQIRLHLWHLGWPICGDTVYLPNRERGRVQTRDVNDEPLCLHAFQIAFTHPKTGERIEFKSPPPSWFVTAD
ncbi:MAG: sulfurtransferase [Deltaproteobacteria bacterium]|nr:sulfurtransferase [Deltaproteobacteria bacterium]